MLLKLKREFFTDQSTIGQLWVNDEPQCWTLEDAVRPTKIKSITAIPAGRYQVVITYSPRFHRALPLLMNVPNFQGIRIHSGNTPNDTEGCILVGRRKGQDKIFDSRLAFEDLFAKLQGAILREEIWIEITGEKHEET